MFVLSLPCGPTNSTQKPDTVFHGQTPHNSQWSGKEKCARNTFKKPNRRFTLIMVFFLRVLSVSETGLTRDLFLSLVKMIIMSGWEGGAEIKAKSILSEKCKSP